MKKLFTILFLLISFLGYSQGNGYLNYKAYRVAGGNGSAWINNGVTYGGQVNDETEFNAIYDTSSTLGNGSSAVTLIGEGVVLANSSQGVAGGAPPNVSGDYYVVEYTGWFYARSTGTYLFYNHADDSSETWIDGVKIASNYGGSGTASGWTTTLTGGQWYSYMFRYHEHQGAGFGYNQIYSSMHNGYFYPDDGSATSGQGVYKVSSTSPTPTFVNTVANDGQNAIIYKSFKINDYASNGGQSEYNAHPQSSSDFDDMFDYANKNTTTWTHYGRDTATKAFTWPWANVLPRHANTNFGWEITGYFVPPTTGTYSFQLSSDDRSDFWMDQNLDGNLTNTNIGLGNGTRTVSINVTANEAYKFRIRFEQGEGGANFYLKWLSPEDAAAGAAYAFNSQSIWSINPDDYVEPLHYDVNFKFGNGITPSNFSVNTHYRVSAQEISKNSNSNSIGLDSWGDATITTQIDETLTADGTNKIRAIPDAGGIATVLGSNQYGTGNMRFYIDNRMFDAGFDFGSISSVEILDIYTGPMIFQNTDPSSIWQFYKIEGLTLTRAIVAQSQYYLPNGWASTGIYEMNPQNNYPYPDFVVTNDWEVIPNQNYKEQYVVFDSPSTTELETLVDDIFTIADVVMAFNELAGGGINGGLKGDFNYNVQYANADLSRDGVFDFKDTHLMLDFLNGGTEFDASYLAAVMSLTELNQYESMTSTNWNNYGTTRTMFPLTLSSSVKQYDKNIAVHWKGDVNMSHSHLPSSFQVTSMAMKNMTIRNSSSQKSTDIEVGLDIEKVGEEIVVTLNVPENGRGVVGSEFRIGYDNSRVTFDRIENTSQLQSFSTKRSNYIKLGSISTDGSLNLNGGNEYKIYFKETNNLSSFLGLVSVLKSELVDKDGNQIGVTVK